MQMRLSGFWMGELKKSPGFDATDIQLMGAF